MQQPNEQFMQMAIDEARMGIAAGQSPFGACIVKDGELMACAHNTVWQTTDITAHAEVTAIRQACQKMGTVLLDGCVLYSTCEPCPMCFSAIHWARIDTIIYGADIADAEDAGFNELRISNEELKASGSSAVAIVGHFMRAENVALFQEWKADPNKRVY